MASSLVVIPTYQESACILELLASLRQVTDVDVLVVDDGSPDGTADLAEQAGLRLGGIFVLRRKSKTGLASAYRSGFEWGLDRGYAVLASMDADLSHDPARLPTLIASTSTAALAIGSRYVAGGSTPDWPLHRRVLSRVANRYARALLRSPVRDMTSGFRAYRAELLRSLEFANSRSDGYAFLVEMADRAVQVGATIEEVPISFRDRENGRSKLSGLVILESVLLVTGWGVWRRLPRRLRDFVQPSKRVVGRGLDEPQ